MSDVVKALAGADGVNLALLLAVLGLAGAVLMLWRQANKEREVEREERRRANAQHIEALKAMGQIVERLGSIVTDLRVTISNCTWRGRDR